MQDVHTCSRLGEPFTMARTRWMLGFQRRLVCRWEWLTFEPKEGCLPHTSHTAAMTRHAPCIFWPQNAAREDQPGPCEVSIGPHADPLAGARALGRRRPQAGLRRLPRRAA